MCRGGRARGPPLERVEGRGNSPEAERAAARRAAAPLR